MFSGIRRRRSPPRSCYSSMRSRLRSIRKLRRAASYDPRLIDFITNWEMEAYRQKVNKRQEGPASAGDRPFDSRVKQYNIRVFQRGGQSDGKSTAACIKITLARFIPRASGRPGHTKFMALADEAEQGDPEKCVAAYSDFARGFSRAGSISAITS